MASVITPRIGASFQYANVFGDKVVNPMEPRFGGVGDGTTDDTAAVQAAVDFLITVGGGTVMLTDWHLITAPITNTTNVPIAFDGLGSDVSRLVVKFTSAAYPSGAAAIDFAYDLSYSNNSVLIQNIGIYLHEESGHQLNTAISVVYADRLAPRGQVMIENCRLDRVSNSVHWLKGIYLNNAPQSRIFDNIIFTGAGPLYTPKTGYGIHLGTYANGTMIHRNSIRGMEFAVYCSSDSVEDAETFQSEGVSIRSNKAQNCNWGVGLFLEDNEVAWSFNDNDFDCGYGGFWIRNLLRFQMDGNTDGWNNVRSDHVGVLLEYDTGTVGDYAPQGIQGLINGGYSLRPGNVDFDVVDVVTGATTTIEWDNLGTAKTVVTGTAVDGDGAITIKLNNVTTLRNKQRVVLAGFTDTGWTTLNDVTYRIGDLDTSAKTVRLYEEDDYEELVDGTGFVSWTSGGTVSRLYSTGELADGDKVWIDYVDGSGEINNSPYVLQDVDTGAKTARITSYYDGTNIDSSSWGAYTGPGSISRYGRAIEVRGGRYLHINGIQVFERNVGLHLWPETKNITYLNPALIRTGRNQALSILDLSNYPETNITDTISGVNDGNARGDGVADDTDELQSVFDAGESLRLRPDKEYKITRALVPTSANQGIYGNNATIVMSTSAEHFDNDAYANRYDANAVGILVTDLDGFFMRDLRMRLETWTDLLYLKAVYFDTCTNILVDDCKFTGFSRGKGIISLNDCGVQTGNILVPAGAIRGGYIGDSYTDSATGTDQERQVTGLDVDADATTGTYGLIVDGVTFANISNSYTSIGGVEGDMQADAIQFAGPGADSKATRFCRVVNCHFINTADGVDVFGDDNIIANNHFDRIFGVGVTLKNGASRNHIFNNKFRDMGLSCFSLNASTRANNQNVDGNKIEGNTLTGLNVAGDWYAVTGVISWDATDAARDAWDATTTMAVYFNYGSNGQSSVPTNTVIENNVFDLEGTGDYGIRTSNHTGGTATLICRNNRIISPATAAYTDAQGYLVFGVLKPEDFGADPTGATSSTEAFNDLFDAVRARINSTASALPYEIDLGGGVYLIDGNGINATEIRTAHNISIRGGTFIGTCAGKHMLDLTGSRYFTFYGTRFYGDETNRPLSGVFVAREVSTASADLHTFYSCSSDGFFTRAGYFNYASENNTHVGCRWWNRYSDADAYAVVVQGDDTYTAASDFATGGAATGTQSCLHMQFTGCTFFRPPTYTLTVNAITKANPAVVTYTGTDPTNGDVIWLRQNIDGMTEVRGKRFTVANVNAGANTFELSGIDSTAYGTYTADSGTAVKEMGPMLFVGSAAKPRFDNCYGNSVNEYAVRLDAIGGPSVTQGYFDIHMEGAHDYAYKLFTNDTGTAWYDLTIKDNSPWATEGMIDTDATSATNQLRLFTIDCGLPEATFTVGIFSDPARFALQTGLLATQQEANFGNTPSAFSTFRCRTFAADGAPQLVEYLDRDSATDSGSGVTCNAHLARIVSQSLTTAAGASATITVTCADITTSDIVIVSRVGGTSTAGVANISAVAGTGSYVITIDNVGAGAFNGTIIIGTQVMKVST